MGGALRPDPLPGGHNLPPAGTAPTNTFLGRNRDNIRRGVAPAWLHWAALRVSTKPRLHELIPPSFESPSPPSWPTDPDGPGGFNPDLEPQRGIGGGGAPHHAGRGVGGGVGGGSPPRSQRTVVPFEDEAHTGGFFLRNAGLLPSSTGAELVLHSTGPAPWRDDSPWSWTERRFREQYLVIGAEPALLRQPHPWEAPHRVEGLVTLRPGSRGSGRSSGGWCGLPSPVMMLTRHLATAYYGGGPRLRGRFPSPDAWRLPPLATNAATRVGHHQTSWITRYVRLASR